VTRARDPFNTYLLRVLCTLLSERSVSRTAIKLNQSQPAISVALKRLRDIFHDPLLVREKGGMVPTERALEIYAAARVALEEIDKLFIEGDKFSPATDTADVQGRLSRLRRRVVSFGRRGNAAQTAPLRACRCTRSDRSTTTSGAGRWHLDIVIGNWPSPPGSSTCHRSSTTSSSA
jgi:DNA-binding transcriptional LysR family regulator